MQQILIPALNRPDIRAVVEYSETEENAVLNVSYQGPLYDVTTQGNDLSLKVLESAAEIAYTWKGNEEYPNRVTLRIRP